MTAGKFLHERLLAGIGAAGDLERRWRFLLNDMSCTQSHLFIRPHPRLAFPFLTADIITVNSSKSMQSLPSWSTYR